MAPAHVEAEGEIEGVCVNDQVGNGEHEEREALRPRIHDRHGNPTGQQPADSQWRQNRPHNTGALHAPAAATCAVPCRRDGKREFNSASTSAWGATWKPC